ncbi:diguanylate cyclase [Paucibacter sp. B2R-40]|uniref:GGDEF domain-containing protein n=1 Tax=Paucibacter sp. B2R-40 TaxID=2893554 RepID=UPI0021E3ABEB|nr:diguanylate cyclase [Paucibacter sp. B2R-40]MCV2354797.1 diguanylate cyclase [Paucibacter sp. B2R-40]
MASPAESAMAKEVILCVDDDSGVLTSLRSLLENSLQHGQLIEIAESGSEALELIDELEREGQTLAVIIADYIMPGMKGDELLVQVHQRLPKVLTILLTGQSSLDGVKRAINEANLFRFLEKPWHNEDVVLTAQAALRAFRLDAELQRHVSELRRMNEQLELTVAQRTQELTQKNLELEQLAVTDCLTRLYNRLFLDRAMEREQAAAGRSGRGFALILVDVDCFKRINDSLGHQAGDAVLVALAQILQSRVRASDVVGRWGGEEFLIICPDTDLAGAQQMAETLRQRIEEFVFPQVGSCTASFGVSVCAPGESGSTAVARADQALYAAKQAGRNRVMLERA